MNPEYMRMDSWDVFSGEGLTKYTNPLYYNLIKKPIETIVGSVKGLLKIISRE